MEYEITSREEDFSRFPPEICKIEKYVSDDKATFLSAEDGPKRLVEFFLEDGSVERIDFFECVQYFDMDVCTGKAKRRNLTLAHFTLSEEDSLTVGIDTYYGDFYIDTKTFKSVPKARLERYTKQKEKEGE